MSGPDTTSSSPVEHTPTRGLGKHATCVDTETCEDAEMCGCEPRSGVEHLLADLEVAARQADVISHGRRVEDVDGRRRRQRVRSTMTTASAPAGIGAPVMIRIASPAVIATFGAAPAASSPITRSVTGMVGDAPAVSDACTA